ncbi:MAG: Sarcosine oxidase alpha subunit [uncultured Solirubrobacteraceae bacterium]|uniref:Sarcosine oxidase alpha subunit n=1 Tax=uncultured Solirubrobacteraceae bacterium TaxID=1162706 RepID=A0A6J4S4F6_9ACTN|nr:MAG: Sarcosine oxidase alpha subunit [uncultured Solirubrobacteraceae bacterium]
MTRLPEQPGERVSRDLRITFRFDGREVEALQGDTIGSALFAAGQRTFSRSFKYHRRRGLLCCAGQCANCLVAVDGAPGVRACTEPVRPGMEVEHLNAKPGLDFDVMKVTDVAGGPFTPPGFYYKTFMRPRRMWPVYEKLLRNVAGLGKLRERQDEREWRTEYRRRHADVVVVGGGLAGLHAALAAARCGADVVLADEGAEPGGRLLAEGGHDEVRSLAREARAAGVEILSPAPALAYFDGLVPVWQGDTLHQVRARRHVFATGTIEQPLVFAGNDLPGVMLSGGARRLAALYGVKPGTRAVVATTSDRGLEAAVALQQAGVQIVAVADARPEAPGPLRSALVEQGAIVLPRSTVIEARGRKQVSCAVLGPVSGEGGSRLEFECDLVVVSGGAAPATSLISQAGARTGYDEADGHFKLVDLPAGVLAAGEVAGVHGREAIVLSGQIAGRQAAHELGLGDEGSRALEEGARRELAGHQAQVRRVAVPPAVAGADRGKCFACLCEDVTAKDIHLSVEEGYDSIELSKRYTTVTMGPCQGRMCQLPSVRLMSQETGQTLQSVGTTTARPPWSTVPMGALAGRPFEPAKRSAIHGRHRDMRANVMWAGDWRRAYDYGDPEGEARNVHDAAGLIDVSTLGKLILRGPDAGEFLDRMYPNRFSNLKPGRIRYGVMASDAGRIVDDGTITRLDDDTFYVTTTSSGAGAVEQWFSSMLADWEMDVHMTDVTQGLSAVNLAGPRAREIMAKVCDLDCSNEAFAYMDGRQATVAGVPALVLRIGFVGEVGYEIHFPAAYGEHVWDALLEAGAEHGLRPFGLEPQRILRLQKMHILVGQDTDSESTPYGAAMPWIVKLDKEQDFIGRWALERFAEQEPEAALVGFTMANGHVPTEGSVVVSDGVPAGQVTSARRSPQVGKVIGLAWVPAALAKDGASITISDAGQTYAADVQTKPFYDPDGEVLRS